MSGYRLRLIQLLRFLDLTSADAVNNGDVRQRILGQIGNYLSKYGVQLPEIMVHNQCVSFDSSSEKINDLLGFSTLGRTPNQRHCATCQHAISIQNPLGRRLLLCATNVVRGSAVL